MSPFHHLVRRLMSKRRNPMKLCLLGPLWGDLCGAPYEFSPVRCPEAVDLYHPQRHFTDDTVLTLAVAKAILEKRPYRDTIYELAQDYPHCGFGGRFYCNWVEGHNPEPYNSFGNGAAMRVAPVGWAFNTVDDVLREAEASAACTHNHPEGIRSAQAVALGIFLARKEHDKEDILDALRDRFGYSLGHTLAEIRTQAERDGFDETWRAVPPALDIFFATDSFEDCLRQAIALGCDADTQACIACSLAEAYYAPDETLAPHLHTFLTPQLLNIFNAFANKFGI